MEYYYHHIILVFCFIPSKLNKTTFDPLSAKVNFSELVIYTSFFRCCPPSLLLPALLQRQWREPLSFSHLLTTCTFIIPICSNQQLLWGIKHWCYYPHFILYMRQMTLHLGSQVKCRLFLIQHTVSSSWQLYTEQACNARFGYIYLQRSSNT